MPSVKTSSALRGTARVRCAKELAKRFTVAQPVLMADFAAEVGRSPTLVRRLLAEAGVTTGGMTCVGRSEAELSAILSARYRSGISVNRLCRETGIDRRALRRLLAGDGIFPRPRASLAVHHIPLVVKHYRKGASLRRLAELYGCSYSTIRRALLAQGITMRRTDSAVELPASIEDPSVT